MNASLPQVARRTLGLLAPAYIAIVTSPTADVSAQVRKAIDSPRMEPSVALARLEQGKSSAALTAAFETSRILNDSSVFIGSFAQYDDVERAQLLNGIERIAREGGEGDAVTATRARWIAFGALRTIGTSPGRAGQAYEVPRRLLRIYDQTANDEAKLLAIIGLGEVLRTSPAESAEIITLLVGLIKQPVVTRESVFHGIVQYATRPVWPDIALDALIWACDAGVGTLRKLYADREEINHNDTRERIEAIAANGFDPNSFEQSLGWPQPCSDVPPHLQGRR